MLVLFGHLPLAPEVKDHFDRYTADALTAGRYDFHMGHKLERFTQDAGLRVLQHFTVDDRELAFDGPALPEVLDAWRERLERMRLLRDACGPSFPAVRDAFLGALARPDHRSTASVHVCLGAKG